MALAREDVVPLLDNVVRLDRFSQTHGRSRNFNSAKKIGVRHIDFYSVGEDRLAEFLRGMVSAGEGNMDIEEVGCCGGGMTGNAEYVDKAREHVEVAVHMLSQMGPEYARIAWVLTDALGFLDEV